MNKKTLKLIGILLLSLAIIGVLTVFEIYTYMFIEYQLSMFYAFIFIMNIPFLMYYLLVFYNKKHLNSSFLATSFKLNKLPKNIALGGILGFIFLSICILILVYIENPKIISEKTSFLSFFYVFVLSVIIGSWEEFYYRGFLNSLFLKYDLKPVTSILLSSIIFSLAHFSAYDFSVTSYFWFFGIFMMGINFSLLYFYSKSIFLSVGMHIIWDFISFGIAGNHNFILFKIVDFHLHSKTLDYIEIIISMVMFICLIFYKKYNKINFLQIMK